MKTQRRILALIRLLLVIIVVLQIVLGSNYSLNKSRAEADVISLTDDITNYFDKSSSNTDQETKQLINRVNIYKDVISYEMDKGFKFIIVNVALSIILLILCLVFTTRIK